MSKYEDINIAAEDHPYMDRLLINYEFYKFRKIECNLCENTESGNFFITKKMLLSKLQEFPNCEVFNFSLYDKNGQILYDKNKFLLQEKDINKKEVNMKINNTYTFGDIVNVKISGNNCSKENSKDIITTGRIFGINVRHNGISYDVLIEGYFCSSYEILSLNKKVEPSKILKEEIAAIGYYGFSNVQNINTKEIFRIVGFGVNDDVHISNINGLKQEVTSEKYFLENFEYSIDI